MSDSAAIFAGLVGTLIWLAVAVVYIAAYWTIFTKAGKPGWAAIIPIFNYYVLLRIVGRPAWWLILMLIPFVNLIIFIIIMLDLARSFGRSTLFGIGLILLAPIFFLILAFGSSRYVGPAATGPSTGVSYAS